MIFTSFTILFEIFDFRRSDLPKVILLGFLYFSYNFYLNIYSEYLVLDEISFKKLVSDSARLILFSDDHWKIFSVLSTLDLILYRVGININSINRQFLIFLRFVYNVWEILKFKPISIVIFILENVLLRFQSNLDNHYNHMNFNAISPTLCLVFFRIALKISGENEVFLIFINYFIPFSLKCFLIIFLVLSNIGLFLQFKDYLNSYKQGKGNNYKLIFLMNCFDKNSIFIFTLILVENLSVLILAYLFLDGMRVFVTFLSVLGLMLPFTLISCINQYKNSFGYFMLNYLSVISSISFFAFSLGYI